MTPLTVVHDSKLLAPPLAHAAMKVVKKAKKELHGPVELIELVNRLSSCAEHELTPTLRSITVWRWPRADILSWIDVLNRFDDILERLSKDYSLPSIQTNPFTPKTKDLVLEILRFTQLLIGNATNRKIYSSYDRLNDLLQTSDIDVLEAALQLDLRFAQQYRRTDRVAEDRLLQLAQGWQVRGGRGLDVLRLADPSYEPDIPSGMTQYQFYRRGIAEATEGLTTISIDRQLRGEGGERSDVDLLAEIAKEHKVPLAAQLGLLQRIRVVKHARNAPMRCRLFVIRCLALAVLPSVANDGTMQSRLFIYESDLIARLTDLIHPERGTDEKLRTASLYALESLSRLRSKASEVLTSVNVAVSHGILMQLVRKTVATLKDTSTPVNDEVVDALFGFLTSIQSHHQHVGGSLVGAGIVPVLIDLIAHAPKDRFQHATRAVQFLETAFYASTNAATAFFGANGVPLYISRIKELVDGEANDQTATSKPMNQHQATLLKALMRAMARMMSNNQGADAMRNLIDSALPPSAQQIMRYRSRFGPQIYALALNITTTFIHNEPTSLAILQEKGLPATMYESLEADSDPSVDVVSAVPNALGALCLNEAGINAFKERAPAILSRMLGSLTSEKHLRVLGDRENATMFGVTIEELMRHHPTLKALVLNAIAEQSKRVRELAGDAVADAEALKAKTMRSVAKEGPATPVLESNEAKHPSLRYIEVLAKFLEGICQSQTHGKELVKTSVVDDLLAAVTAPSLAPFFPEAGDAIKAVIGFFKAVSETSNVVVLASIIKVLRSSLAELQPYSIRSLHDDVFDDLIGAETSEAVAVANKAVISLWRVRTLLALLGGVVPHITYTQSRGVMSSALNALSIQTTGDAPTPSILSELASLSKLCTWEVARLHPSTVKSDMSAAMLNGPLTAVVENASQVPVSDTQEEANEGADGGPVARREANANVLRALLRAISTAYRSISTAIIARPPPRRTPDTKYKDEAKRFADLAAKLAAEDLVWPDAGTAAYCPAKGVVLKGGVDDNGDLPYALIAIKSTSDALKHERWATSTGSSLAVGFVRHGGCDRLIALYKRFATLCAESLAAKESDRTQRIVAALETETDPSVRMRLLQGVSGLRVCLELLAQLASRRVMPEGVGVTSGAGAKSEPTPYDFVVRLRADILPVVLETWNSPLLDSLPPANVQLIFGIILTILEADGEKASQWQGGTGTGNNGGGPAGVHGLPSVFGLAPQRAPFQLDQTRLQHVMDMGFPRGAASYALRRYHNNANAAAEYLLQHPEVVLQHNVSDAPAIDSPDTRSEVGGPTAASGGDAAAAVAMSTDGDAVGRAEEPTPGLQVPEVNHAETLAEARRSVAQTFVPRAIELLSIFPQLVFDIRDACKLPALSSTSGITLATQALEEQMGVAKDEGANAGVAATMRLLAILVTDSRFSIDFGERTAAIMAVITPYLDIVSESPSIGPELPAWLAALLLICSSLFSHADAPQRRKGGREQDMEDESTAYDAVRRGPSYSMERRKVFDIVVRVLRSGARDDDTWSAALRAATLLTQEADLATLFARCGVTMAMLKAKATVEAKGCQDLAVMILRHLVEVDILQALMKRDLADAVRTQPGCHVDATTAMSMLKHAASRDPVTFLRTMPTTLKLFNGEVNVHSSAVTLLEPVPAGAPEELARSIPPIPASRSATAEEAIDAIAGELRDRFGKAAARLSPAEDQAEEAPSDLIAIRFHLGCLVELLNSYMPCKIAFIRHEGKGKPDLSILSFILDDLIPFDTLRDIGEDKAAARAAKTVRVSEWASLLVAALCADIGPHQPQAPELASLRASVVDSLCSAIRQLSSSTEATSARHARLVALADLCLRLAVPAGLDSRRPNRQPREDIHADMAKLMIDKDMAGVLCAALAELDLNFPGVESTINRIMRPLHILSRMVGKLGPLRAVVDDVAPAPPASLAPSGSETSDDSQDDDGSDGSDEQGSDVSMAAGEEEDDAQEDEDDPYRNSALGMFEGELEPGGMQVEYASAVDEDFDEDGEDMDGIEEGGPAPIVPSDESSDEGDPAQGFRDDESIDDEEEDELDQVLDDLPVVDHGSGFRDDDDDDIDDEDDEGGSIEHESSVRETSEPPLPAWGAAFANAGEDGADDLANELANQLDDMHAHGPDAGQRDGEAAGPDGESQQGDSDEEMHDMGDDDEDDDDEGQRIEIQAGIPGDPLAAHGMWGGDGLGAGLPGDMEMFGRAGPRPIRVDEPRIVGGIGSTPVQRDSLRDVGQHALLVNSDINPALARQPAGRRIGAPPRGGSSALPSDQRGPIEDILGHGTFALLEQFMQGMQGPGGRGLAQLFNNMGGLRDADIVIEARDGAVRHTGRIRAGHPQREGRGDVETPPPAPAGPVLPAALTPASTALRWDQEARLLQGVVAGTERIRILTDYVLALLRPQARKAHTEREERVKREAEEAAKAEVEAESKEAAMKEEANDGTAPIEKTSATNDDAMESVQPADVSRDDVVRLAQSLATGFGGIPPPEATLPAPATQPSSAAVEASTAPASAGPAPARVVISIHGEDVDITDTGIDPTFLEALPDDMREEIVNQHHRDARPAAGSSTSAPSHISSEFLDALPPAIRAEVLQQEALEQMRQRQPAAAPAHAASESAEGRRAPATAEMDAASFLATIDDPTLRESVLLEHLESGGDDFLETLPPNMLPEVQRIQQRLVRQRRGAPRNGPAGDEATRGQAGQAIHEGPPKKQRREIIQLVDKAGLATLIRLLFLPQSLEQSTLHSLLINICAHDKTRIDLVIFLLTVLHDGTKDAKSIERSYSHVAGRASKATTTPRTIQRTMSADSIGESAPDLVAQRCLDALCHLVEVLPAASSFFLQEQEGFASAGRKATSARKGKGKEREKTTALPLALLLDLLERPSFLASQGLMESTATLLSAVTRPLLATADKAAEVRPLASVPTEDGGAPAAAPSDAAAAPADPATAPPAEPSITPAAPVKEISTPKTRPDLSPETLRRLINVLDGECSSKTFQQTLGAIHHLSTLPGALDSLTTELVDRASQYAKAMQGDLEKLKDKLSNSASANDFSAVIMDRFSSSSADQAKLLRVLKTLDYMYSKANVKAAATAGPGGAPTTMDANRLPDIFRSMDLAEVYGLVGECLAAIDAKEGTESAATALLPLIEALMVVSRPLLKSTTPAQVREAMSPGIMVEPAESRELSEPIFLSFARRHRKLLNMLVRNSPSLVSGSFSVLIQVPGVLDFEAKRNYFFSRLHKGVVRNYGSIPLNIRRAYLFEDTFQALHRRSAQEIKHGRLSIRFYNEEGVDAGGLTRDWATQLVKRIFNPNYALFSPSSSDALVWQPNPQSYVNPDHLAFFAFVGRIIAKFVYDGRLLDAFFCRSFYKHLLGIPVSVSDLESVDPDSYRSLTWMLDNDIEGVLDLTFSVETDAFGVNTTVDLKPGGHEMAVTNANKREYVELVATHRLTLSISDQINAFVKGFTEIIPRDLVSVFSPQELQLLISGLPDIDADEWRSNTDYAGGLTAASPSVTWFWRAVRSMSQEERAKLLQFATGSSRVPLEGFGSLQGVSGVTRFTIVGAHTTDALPSAHTCFNQLDLPNFSSYEALRDKLVLAISETEGFGFA